MKTMHAIDQYNSINQVNLASVQLYLAKILRIEFIEDTPKFQFNTF